MRSQPEHAEATSQDRPVLRAQTRARRSVSVLLAVVAVLAGWQAAPAQRAPTLLEVRVVDSLTGEPLPHALVLLDDRSTGLTGAGGLLRIPDLPAGTVRLQVRFLGHREWSAPVRILADGPTRVQVMLAPEPIALRGVRAAAYAQPRSPEVRGFYERAKRGGGRYITRADIDRQKPQRLGDLFRLVPGIAVRSSPLAERAQLGVSSTPLYGPEDSRQECPILYYLDGTPLDVSGDGIFGLDVRPGEVEGIEIYLRTADVPARYRRSIKQCGVVLIWKRERH